MKVLIIYGSIEGQTRKIARFMEEVLQEENHPTVISNATEDPPSPDKFDVILIGSSIHLHKYNSAVKSYVTNHSDILNSKPSAFFSVCMAVASSIPEEHEEAAKIAQDFLDETGWKTNTVWQIAGALRYTQYDYFKKLTMRMIAKKQGGATDTSKDHEYTDWGKVKRNVLEFVGINT
ncbi:MAG: hypothetical protein KDD31_08775 [Muricauda sp.]|nr:hypothetical protein [Allomuricauda sp.]